MNAKFIDLNAAADFLGPGAIEVNRYQNEITDIVRRRGVFGQRIKQMPATGHPSRFFEQTAIVSPSRGQCLRRSAQHLGDGWHTYPRGAQRAAEGAGFADQLQPVRSRSRRAAKPVRIPPGQRPGGFRRRSAAYARRRTVEWHRHFAEQPDHAAILRRHRADLRRRQHAHPGTGDPIVDNLKSIIANMVANSSFEVRPTAIYANPVLLDLIDREMKDAVQRGAFDHRDQRRLARKALSTQAGDIPLIPEWSLGFTGTPGSGTAVLPCYIVTEDMIEYHWLTDPNPRVFQLGLPGSLASQMVVVKFGGVVVKGASYAHTEVKVTR